MKTLIDLEFVKKYSMFPRSGLILVGVSGGADSMCLLHNLMELSEKYDFTVAAMHYNHCLRGAESDEDAQFVMKYCKSIGIQCFIGKGNVAANAKRLGLGIEETARKMRYEFFYKTVRKTGAEKIATAHTADDNAETVIFNLTRGSGTTGIAGIPPVRGVVVRPLLKNTRAQIEKYLEEHNIPHREDSTNADDTYTRNNIRHNVIPVLKSINPSFCENISTTSYLLAEDNKLLDAAAFDFIVSKISDCRVRIDDLLALPYPVASRVIRKMAPTKLSFDHVSSVFKLCESKTPSAKIDLPGFCVQREYDYLIFAQEQERFFNEIGLPVDSTAYIPSLKLKITCVEDVFPPIINKSLNTFWFKKSEICGNILVRPRKSGDRISILNSAGSKSLKKLFIEQHIPASKRHLVPIISDDNGPMAVYGIGIDKRFAADAGDAVLKITIEEII